MAKDKYSHIVRVSFGLYEYIKRQNRAFESFDETLRRMLKLPSMKGVKKIDPLSERLDKKLR